MFERVRNRRGAGSIGCLLMLLLVGAGIYAGVQIGMPKFRHSSFTERLTEIWPYLGRQSEDIIRQRLIETAAEFDIHLRPDQVKIQIQGDRLTYEITYEKVADLKYKKKVMPFSVRRTGPY
jgi:hypothetical protein